MIDSVLPRAIVLEWVSIHWMGRGMRVWGFSWLTDVTARPVATERGSADWMGG
jgi:hypothetical protein